MRAVRFHEHGGPGVLQVDDVESPEPGPGELLVEVEAVGVNPVDTYFREGEYPVPELPFVPGSDLAGVVAAVGPGVEAFAEGDRVAATGLGNGRPGTYAERALAPADHAAPLPEGVGFAEGAALALVGVTAWQALVHHADLSPGTSVLIHGGSGGVGHVAVQLADALETRVVATAREPYHTSARGLGADAALDYSRADLADAVPEAAGGPVDTVLDTRVDEYLPLDVEVAGQGARVVAIGNAEEAATVEPLAATKAKELRLQFMSMFNTGDTGGVLRQVLGLCADGAVVPEIARSYDLTDVAEAQRAVIEDSFLGKLVLTP